MPEPLKAAALRGLGEPRGSFLVVDPGGRCGVALIDAAWDVYTVQLDELAGDLHHSLWMPRVYGPPDACAAFVVCEDFSLAGGRAGAVQAGSKMPSSQGIGMCRVACEWTDTPLFLMPPNCKRAGHQALDAAGRAAYEAARNDHERDVVDISGFVLREVRR